MEEINLYPDYIKVKLDEIFGTGIAEVKELSYVDGVHTIGIVLSNGLTTTFEIKDGITPDLTQLEQQIASVSFNVGMMQQELGLHSGRLSALDQKKAENVHLWCDGSDIFYFNDQTHPLTYVQVKQIIEDDKNSVFLTNGYYSMYGKYRYMPEITGNEKKAVGFIGETMIDGEPYMWRVIINEDNVVKEDEIWLGKHEDIAELEGTLTEHSAKIVELDGRVEYLEEGGGGGGGTGSVVTVNPILTSGTKIAEITVNGSKRDIFSPSEVTDSHINGLIDAKLTPLETLSASILSATNDALEVL